VYLVRTPTPVYGTTHHVLKRMAVANEAMLSEVKKEVDVMVRAALPDLGSSFTVFHLRECSKDTRTSST